MTKLVTTLLFNLILVTACFSQNRVYVDTYKTCWVALINDEDAQSKQYKWWSLWHEIKKNGNYEKTPTVFSDLREGKYTLVVYNPSSSSDGSSADGVVFESLNITSDSKFSFSFGPSDFKDWNCLSCPWLYVFDGKDYVRKTEILKDLVGEEARQTTRYTIQSEAVVDGKLKIKIQEEKEEITHLDQLLIDIGGKKYPACQINGITKAQLTASDNNFILLKKGESIELEFNLPKNLPAGTALTLESEGYYIPDAAFLEAIYKKYLRSVKK